METVCFCWDSADSDGPLRESEFEDLEVEDPGSERQRLRS
jgi:hypothetical protein